MVTIRILDTPKDARTEFVDEHDLLLRGDVLNRLDNGGVSQ